MQVASVADDGFLAGVEDGAVRGGQGQLAEFLLEGQHPADERLVAGRNFDGDGVGHENLRVAGHCPLPKPRRHHQRTWLHPDPRPVASFVVPPVTSHTPWTYQKVTYEPTPGRLLLFPAWLPHGVEPNLSDADRVVISFNIGLVWAT